MAVRGYGGRRGAATQKPWALSPSEKQKPGKLEQWVQSSQHRTFSHTSSSSSPLALLLQDPLFQFLRPRIAVVGPAALELLDLLQELCDVVGHGDPRAPCWGNRGINKRVKEENKARGAYITYWARHTGSEPLLDKDEG